MRSTLLFNCCLDCQVSLESLAKIGRCFPHKRTHTHAYTTSTHTHTRTNTYTHTHKHTHTRTHKYAHTHVHTHTNTHKHAHTRMSPDSFLNRKVPFESLAQKALLSQKDSHKMRLDTCQLKKKKNRRNPVWGAVAMICRLPKLLYLF